MKDVNDKVQATLGEFNTLHEEIVALKEKKAGMEKDETRMRVLAAEVGGMYKKRKQLEKEKKSLVNRQKK